MSDEHEDPTPKEIFWAIIAGTLVGFVVIFAVIFSLYILTAVVGLWND